MRKNLDTTHYLQKAAAIANGIYQQMRSAAIAGRDLVGNNPYGLTPTEVVAAFDTFSQEQFTGWWAKGAALVDFVNAVVPGAIEPLTNPAPETTTAS